MGGVLPNTMVQPHLSIFNSKKVTRVLIFQGTPPLLLYEKIQTFLKLVLDMFSTSEVMQTGNPTTYKHVSLMHHTFISF